MEDQAEQLAKVLKDFAVPDPNIVGKLPKGGFTADFIGHADINRLLIEIDPLWSLEPLEIIDGRPAAHTVDGDVFMWFKMTLLGHTRLAVGSAKVKTSDLDKILYGDALRNGAMRFGIGLKLWSKQEWEDLDHYDSAPVAKPAPKNPPKVESADTLLSISQVNQFKSACQARGINPDDVASAAGLGDSSKWTEGDLDKLRKSFKKISENM